MYSFVSTVVIAAHSPPTLPSSSITTFDIVIWPAPLLGIIARFEPSRRRIIRTEFQQCQARTDRQLGKSKAKKHLPPLKRRSRGAVPWSHSCFFFVSHDAVARVERYQTKYFVKYDRFRCFLYCSCLHLLSPVFPPSHGSKTPSLRSTIRNFLASTDNDLSGDPTLAPLSPPTR